MKAIQGFCSSCTCISPYAPVLAHDNGRLEVFNSVIYHHPTENANLLYGILRAHKTFENLGTFTLARGLREIRRIQQAKDEQAQKDPKGKSRASDVEQPHEEKQRLLERENSNALGLTSRLQSADSLTEVRVDSISGTQAEGTAAAGGGAAGESVEDTTFSQPLMSPTATSPPSGAFPPLPAVSEKARGKMRDRGRSLSLETDASLDRVALAGVGRNGFVPSQEWVRNLSEPYLFVITLMLYGLGDFMAARVRSILRFCGTFNL